MPKISTMPEWDTVFNLMLDPDVSEIEANGPSEFFMKKKGKRIKIDEISLPTEERYMRGVQEGLVPFVKSLSPFDPEGFLFEGRLNYEGDGIPVSGRCHIVLPPSADTPQVTIAKKTANLKTVEDLAAYGSMSSEMMNFLITAVKAGCTIVFSGGTGSGKTTMLEAVSKYIPRDKRIGVAEDAPELVLTQDNVTYLRSVPWQPGMDANNVATLSWVVAQFQRMRTDLLIVGETRGKEFADFLVAANSGMDGSMTTIHSDDPAKALMKMTNFAMKGSERQPTRAINGEIANAVHIIVQLAYIGDKYRTTHIQEVTPTLGNTEEAKIASSPLFVWDRSEDMFRKEEQMTDRLRNYITERGQSVDEFLRSPRGQLHPAHSLDLSTSALRAKEAQDAKAAAPNAGRTIGGGGIPRPVGFRRTI
jgi:pilus assembly protein CpaF